MVRIENLEIHVAHACNLACESCSHYSDHNHKGVVSIEEAREWMAPWAGRIEPRFFSLLGGEPTIHPQLTKFVRLAREHWPRSNLRIVTNGFFLHRHPDLPAVLRDDGNANLYISVHHDSPEYRSRMVPVIELAQRWARDYGLRIPVYPSGEMWTRRYKGFGAAMEPYEDRQPRRSWEICTAKTCPQLFDGRIWKCSQLAYLGMQDARFKLSERWKPYLDYRPLEPGCSDEALREFFSREEESHCSMCPSKDEHFALPVPIRMHARKVAI